MFEGCRRQFGTTIALWGLIGFDRFWRADGGKKTDPFTILLQC
jgi:hypothetical protein